MAEDTVDVVLDHDCNGFGFAVMRGIGVFGEFLFKVGEPQAVPREFGEALVAGYPGPPNQGNHVFKIVTKQSPKGFTE
jgi:hypothetical protein